MGYEIFIFGEEIDVTKYKPEDFVLRENKCIASFNTKEKASFAIDDINKSHSCKAFFTTEIRNLLNKPLLEYENLPNLDYFNLIENNFYKEEQFIILNDSAMSLLKIKNEDVLTDYRNKINGNIKISSTGIFMINRFKNALKCYVQDFTQPFNDFYFDSDISDVLFSNSDTFMAVYTQHYVYIIDIYKGIILISRELEEIAFGAEEYLVYFFNSKKAYCLRSNQFLDFPKDLNVVKCNDNQSFNFFKGKSQKIIYQTNGHKTVKTQANIENIYFGFVNSLGYAFITKKIKDSRLYSLEIYCDDKIFAITFDNKPKSYVVSDKMIVVFSSNNLVFYRRLDKVFSKFKEIEKNGDILLSLFGNVSCIFDDFTENLEFYDKGELRCVYLHRKCTKLQWSTSGLYLAAISNESGVLQLFNNNGKLLFKKVYNVFDKFIWRPFIKLNSTEKEMIKEYDLNKYIDDLSTSKVEEYNLDVLIANWKTFLIGKQKLLQNKN